MQLLKSHLHTGNLTRIYCIPKNTPLQEHLCRAASVLSCLKLIIRIIQQILSYARNFYKFYMDSFSVSIF